MSSLLFHGARDRLWIGDFTGAGHSSLLVHRAPDRTWWLVTLPTAGAQFAWSNVGETGGFGNLLDGHHPMRVGDFDGNGRDELLFHSRADGNWWMGSLEADALTWQRIGNTSGFGDLLDGNHPLWTGGFSVDGQDELLFHFTGDGNWWRGRLVAGELLWTLVGNTAGFGNLADGHHPTWNADFDGDGRTNLLFHFTGDGNWWLGTLAGDALHWTLVSNTANFGNLLDGRHIIHVGTSATGPAPTSCSTPSATATGGEAC